MGGPLLSMAIPGKPVRTLRNVQVARPPAASLTPAETVPRRRTALRVNSLHATVDVYCAASAGGLAPRTRVGPRRHVEGDRRPVLCRRDDDLIVDEQREAPGVRRRHEDLADR